MPTPGPVALTEQVKAAFVAQHIELPLAWADMGQLFAQAFSPAERAAAPTPPSSLFREKTLNSYHVDTAKTIGEAYAAWIEGICGALASGLDQWFSTAIITGVLVNGPIGMVSPGNVFGPPLTPLILAGGAPTDTPQKAKYSTAVATAVGNAWATYTAGIMGVLSYPALAFVAMPVCPPTPNIPVPLSTLMSGAFAQLQAASLRAAMLAAAGDAGLHAAELFGAVATGFETWINTSLLMTTVNNVLAIGPVPMFQPPLIPGGPVVGGIGTGYPGCLA